MKTSAKLLKDSERKLQTLNEREKRLDSQNKTYPQFSSELLFAL